MKIVFLALKLFRHAYRQALDYFRGCAGLGRTRCDELRLML